MTIKNNYQIYLLDSTTGSTGNYAVLDTEGVDISNTFQVADIADISKRKDAITKTISFKATKNNNIIFGNLSNLNRMVDDTVNLSFFFNFNITKDIDCQVYENSTLIFVGKLRFIAANRDASGNITYDCSIVGYMVDFFNKIQDKLLSELDFTPFNHTYDITHIKNSWSNIYTKNGTTVTGTTGKGYVYPLIDYGAGVTTDTSFDNKYDYRNMRPAFYVREYFNAIFNQSGLTGDYRFTVTGSTAFLDEFNKAIVPNNDSEFSYTKEPGVYFEVAKTINPTQYNGVGQTTYDNTNKVFQYNHLITFDKIITGFTNTIVDPILTDAQRIVFKNAINTTITSTVNVTSSQLEGTNGTIRCLAMYRSTPQGQFESIGEADKVYNYTGSDLVQFNDAYTFNFSFTHQFEAGSELALLCFLDYLTHNGNFSINVISADLKIGSPLANSQVTLKLGDSAILVGQNTQQLKQIDFLKSLIQMFNLYVYPDPEDSRHIYFIPYNDYYSKFTVGNIIDNAIDWTDKISNATFSQTPVADIFNLYKFTFQDDSDFYSKYYKDKWGDTYGNLTVTGNTNGQNQSIELIFGSTPVASYNGRSVPALWELDTNNLKKEKVTVPRILFYNGLVNCPTYEIGIVALSASTETYYFSSIDSANIANYTFSKYAEANEFTLSSNNEFVDLSFSIPNEVFYTNGGTLSTYGSGRKTLYDRYYLDMFAELNDSNTRIVETTAYLNEIDIQNLDFRVPVYFNSVLGHNYFKLLSVEYSNSSEPSTIKLQTAFIKDSGLTFNSYTNDTYSVFLDKNDCTTAGYAGESTYYIVSAGDYTSFISKADANAMAANEAATSGQTLANANGVCVYTGTTFNLGFDDNPTDAYNDTTRSNYYTNTGDLTTGAIIFKKSSGNYVRNIASFYSNDDTYYQTNSHSAIIFSAATSTLSSTQYDDYYIENASEYTSCQLANDGHTTYVNYKISDPYPRAGTVVKDTTGVSAVADAWYSDGTNSYHVVSGIITDIVPCNHHPLT